MNRGTRLGLLAAAVVVAVVAFVIAKSSSDNGDNNSSTTTGATGTSHPAPVYTQIKVTGAKPVGGITKIKVSKGDRVRFTVTSDVADEVHVHGYDFMKDVPAGGTIRFNFPARIAGSFEIELEGRKEQIAALQVEP